MHFTFDFNMWAFFGLDDPFEYHCKRQHFVSERYWKTKLSSPMINQFINSMFNSTCPNRSITTFLHSSHWEPLGTEFFIFRFQISNRQMVSQFMFFCNHFIDCTIQAHSSWLCCHLFMWSMVNHCDVISNIGSAFRNLIPMEGLWSQHNLFSKRLLKLTVNCHSILMEFHTHQNRIPCALFHNSIGITSQADTPNWEIAGPC